MALDGGGDGLDIAWMLVRLAPSKLKKNGALIMELGGAQAKKIMAAMPDAVWKEKRTHKDLNGIERFVFAVLNDK